MHIDKNININNEFGNAAIGRNVEKYLKIGKYKDLYKNNKVIKI